jgi:hypothetical protein
MWTVRDAHDILATTPRVVHIQTKHRTSGVTMCTLSSHVKSHDRLPQYLHTTVWPISLFNCFFSLSRHLTKNTVFLNLHYRGNMVGMSVWVWLTQSCKTITHKEIHTTGSCDSLNPLPMSNAPNTVYIMFDMNCIFTHLITLEDLTSFCISYLFCFQKYKVSVLCVIVWVPSSHLQEGTVSKEMSSSHNAAGHPYHTQSLISLRACSNMILKNELTSTRSYIIHGWRYGLCIATATVTGNG